MAQALSLETAARIAQLRVKAADGTLTQEDMREAVLLLRGDRRSAAAASDTARRAKAKAAIPDADDLLNELGGA